MTLPLASQPLQFKSGKSFGVKRSSEKRIQPVMASHQFQSDLPPTQAAMYINTQEQVDLKEAIKLLKKKEPKTTKAILLGKKKLSGPVPLKDKEMYLPKGEGKGIFTRKKMSARPKFTRKLAP